MRADIHDGQGAIRSLQRAEYRCARPIISRSSHPACTARPVHTKYMIKWPRPRSQTWRTFLRNHAPDIAAIDLFVVPTISFGLLYGLGRGLKSCPEQDSDELNGGKEVGGVLFEACGDAAGMFELVEEALD